MKRREQPKWHKTMTALSIDTLQKEILEREVQAFLQGSVDPEAQARYAALLQEVEDEEITEERCQTLAGILEIIVESGRARKLYGPPGENSLTSLFQKTSRGAALTQMSTQVNQALRGLKGQTLEGINFRSSGPGSWVLTLQTDHCELTLRIDRKGIRVDNLGVDFV
jgi:hypothetical protein